MCNGSEAGSYSRLIDVVYYSTPESNQGEEEEKGTVELEDGEGVRECGGGRRLARVHLHQTAILYTYKSLIYIYEGPAWNKLIYIYDVLGINLFSYRPCPEHV